MMAISNSFMKLPCSGIFVPLDDPLLLPVIEHTGRCVHASIKGCGIGLITQSMNHFMVQSKRGRNCVAVRISDGFGWIPGHCFCYWIIVIVAIIDKIDSEAAFVKLANHLTRDRTAVKIGFGRVISPLIAHSCGRIMGLLKCRLNSILLLGQRFLLIDLGGWPYLLLLFLVVLVTKAHPTRAVASDR